MTPYVRALTLGACAAFLAGGTVGQAQRRGEPSGPDAFLAFQVESTDELVAVLKTNPTLRKRYAKHFGVSEAEVVDFVKRSLVPYRLPADRAVNTYGVTKTGRIYSVRTRLKKGTRVWANRSGVPILKWLCANPLTKRLPGTKIASPKLVRPPHVAQVRPVRSLTPMVENAVAPPIVISENFTPPVFASESGLEGTGIGNVAPIIPPGIGSSVRFPLGGLAAAAFIPFAFNGGGVTTPTPPTPPRPPDTIPEPATLVLLASGMPVGLVVLRRLRRRGRHHG